MVCALSSVGEKSIRPRGRRAMGGGHDDDIIRDIPLARKYELGEVGEALRGAIGCCDTGAHMAIGMVEANALGRSLSYSRHMGHWTAHHAFSYRGVTGAADYFRQQSDLCESFVPAPGQRGWQSTLTAKPALVDLVGNLLGDSPLLRLVRPSPGVILRDANGTPQRLPNTRAISRMIKRMAELNEGQASADLRIGQGPLMTAPMCRMFKHCMGMGGRLFCQGSSYQNAPRALRRDLTMDGEATSEADYKNLHPRLLDAEIGAVPPSDCYDIGAWPRPLVKRAMLILLNALTKRKALGAIVNCDAMKAMGLPDIEAKKQANQLIDDIKDAHRPIAKAFHSGVGLRLQHIESQMAERVMLKALRQGFLALSMHDGFIAKNCHAQNLEDIMAETALDYGLRGPIVELQG